MKTLEEIVFKRERLTVGSRLSNNFIANAKIDVIQDHLYHSWSTHLDAYFYTHLKDTQTITVYHKRPTFFEWLFRKKIAIEVSIECKELFRNPPELDHNPFLYVVKQV